MESDVAILLGGKSKSEALVKKVRKENATKERFEQGLLDAVAASLMNKLGDCISKADSFSGLIEELHDINSGEKPLEASTKEVNTFRILNANAAKHFNKTNLIDDIGNKVTFSIKEIRSEVINPTSGKPVNQRTFAKWLDHYFPGKYTNRKRVTLFEYREIFECLILTEEEKTFNFKVNVETLYRRLTEGIVFSKERLLSLDQSLSYKTLAENAGIDAEAYKNMDLLPFRFAHSIEARLDLEK